MILIVGLGNPGAKYAYNRHNIGWLALDDIAERHGFGPFRKKFKGVVAEGRLAGDRALLLKPHTYMNDSGKSVAQAARFFKVPPDRVIVIYDELDLAQGKCRAKRGGGGAGHNGIRSIDSHMAHDYWRVRLGIGHPGDRHRVRSHVLSDFSDADEDWLDPLLEAVAEAIPLLADGENEKFMTKVALLTSKKKPAPPKSAADG
ncbi:MAG: aminoacyl-tRNA hydrolase [Pseudomonadota bacterium]